MSLVVPDLGPSAISIGNVSSQPFFLKTPDLFTVNQERQFHDEAIYAFGEYSMFILMWHIEDFEAGLCQRCPTCSPQNDSIQQDIFDAYKQPQIYLCPQCYGTTYFKITAPILGGLKARIVRPTLWDPTDVEHQRENRGDIPSSTADVQSISDFRMRSGDYIFRADQSRWRMETINTQSLTSGFQAQDDLRTLQGYQYPSCKQVIDEASPSFIIPPDGPTLASLLDIPLQINYPEDFSTIEIINGALIADDFATPPPSFTPIVLSDVTSFNTRIGAVTLTKSDVLGTGLHYSDVGAGVAGAAAAAEAALLAALDTIYGGAP